METLLEAVPLAAGHRRYKSIDTTNNDPLPCPSPPTEDEAELYYRGLGDSAKLIARSSREPIQLYRNRGLLSKHFKSPTPHRQLDQHFKPNSALVADLIQRLNENMVEDCHMFVTTIVGPSHVSRLTLCILVTASDAPNWPRAQRSVDACLKVLWRYDIHDVEVEMMSTSGAVDYMQRGPQATDGDFIRQVQQLPDQAQKQSVTKASQLLNDTEYNPLYMVAASEYLGTSLTPVGGTGYGCKGPYVNMEYLDVDGRRVATIAAITCRHVVFDDKDSRMYTPEMSRTHPIPIKQLPLLAVEEDVCAGFDIHLYEKHRSVAKRSVTRLEVYREQKKNTEASIELDIIEKSVAKARSHSDSVLKILKYQDLTFGKVILSPPLRRRTAPEPPTLKFTTVDWALISLDMSLFPSRDPENRFYAPPEWVPKSIDTVATSLGLTFPNLADEGLDMHQIRGTASLDELQQEMSGKENVKHALTGTIVCKYGPRTGLTFGVCNRYGCIETKAGCRETWFLVVYGWREEGVSPYRFSNRRDSGAGVVTLEGRLIGILTAGDDDSSFDASLVTPYQTLREEFRDAANTNDMRDLSIALR